MKTMRTQRKSSLGKLSAPVHGSYVFERSLNLFLGKGVCPHEKEEMPFRESQAGSGRSSNLSLEYKLQPTPLSELGEQRDLRDWLRSALPTSSLRTPTPLSRPVTHSALWLSCSPSVTPQDLFHAASVCASFPLPRSQLGGCTIASWSKAQAPSVQAQGCSAY